MHANLLIIYFRFIHTKKYHDSSSCPIRESMVHGHPTHILYTHARRPKCITESNNTALPYLHLVYMVFGTTFLHIILYNYTRASSRKGKGDLYGSHNIMNIMSSRVSHILLYAVVQVEFRYMNKLSSLNKHVPERYGLHLVVCTVLHLYTVKEYSCTVYLHTSHSYIPTSGTLHIYIK